MTPEHIETLKANRDALARELQAVLDLPEAERPVKPTARRAWVREMDRMRRTLDEADKLVQHFERPPRPARIAPDETPAAQEGVTLARIRKSDRAELRVTAGRWKGRRTIDLRIWSMFEGSDEMRPSRKGVAIDASKLDALIEALVLAKQCV